MKQTVRVVLLATDKSSQLTFQYNKMYRFAPQKQGYFENGYPIKNGINNPQHLYLTSNEEIKEGDYFYSVNEWLGIGICKLISEKKQTCIVDTPNFKNHLIEANMGFLQINNANRYKKVIASTDISLELPSISDEDLAEYVKSYNAGNIINEWEVEMERKLVLNLGIDVFNSNSHIYNNEIKTTPDNNVIICKEKVIGKPLDDYIRAKHTQEECIGFIDGYNAAKEKLYTKEEVINILHESRKYVFDEFSQNHDEFNEWIKTQLK